MANCPECGASDIDGKKFCRNCGRRLDSSSEDAATWRLPTGTSPVQGRTAETSNPTSPAYIPPAYELPSQPPIRYEPEYAAGRSNISLGDWLAQGWRIYSENWVVMSMGAVIGAALSALSLGILAGPLLMGLYQMAFKTMRSERPELGDLFKWEGRFLQAFLAFLILAAIHLGFTGAGDGGIFAVLSFVVDPILTIALALVLPLILERKIDVVRAINEVGRLIFSKDALMWWVVGLVFVALSAIGFFGCFVGVFVTLPWILSSAAVAYRDIFGFDDPNRTLP
jgi:hypothetical protein